MAMPTRTTSRSQRAVADEALVDRARAGDDEALGALMGRYRSVARGKASNYFLVGGDRDDVVQEAMIGLYKAVRDWAPDGGASFRTFAEVCVTRQVLTAVRSASRHKHGVLTSAVPLDAPTGDADEGATLADLLPAADQFDPADAVAGAEQLRALQQHLAEVLSDLEQQVLRHHVEGKTYDEIAAVLQRHVKSVDNALQRIRRKLQDHLVAREA